MRIPALWLAWALPLAAQAVDPAFLNQLITRHRPEPLAYQFALIGDQQYERAGGIPKWPALINSMNSQNLAFVIHDGDFKDGASLCSDAIFQERLESFNTSAHPLVYTPGDNEWTDCHRANNGPFDPIDRLALIRRMFFPTSDSLGRRTIRLTRQSEDPRYTLYRENALWSWGNALFATVHVVGSNNNLGRTPEQDVEYRARNDANQNWIHTAFSVARDSGFSAVMLIMQANPGFELSQTDPNRTGFNDTLFALEGETIGYRRPVYLVHGDSHYFRIDKPLLGAKSGRRVENFTRVETFGEFDVHWTRVRVEPANPNVFVFEQVLVPENLVDHTR